VGPAWTEIDSPRSLRRTLSVYRTGTNDPTTRLGPDRFLRATLTPDGPGTILITWRDDPAPVDASVVTAQAWGPGAGWLLARVGATTGRHDRAIEFCDAHPVVARSLRLTRHTRVGRSGQLYHQLLPTIIAQRITSGEAVRQWHRLCRALGEPAPGPADVVGDLVLPPNPASLHRRPAWWFHPLGIESKRARALTAVARHADRFWSWAESSPQDAAAKLALIPGVGCWTIGSVLGPALGDPDAVPVGDYHFPNTVAWALADEPRADDARMLELLSPYEGQRGRVLRAIVSTAGRAPAFGPRRRILPMARW
jgi:3-methyladenine DNA glycosylase/8-oxoguanine DNA glycosylase